MQHRISDDVLDQFRGDKVEFLYSPPTLNHRVTGILVSFDERCIHLGPVEGSKESRCPAPHSFLREHVASLRWVHQGSEGRTP